MSSQPRYRKRPSRSRMDGSASRIGSLPTACLSGWSITVWFSTLHTSEISENFARSRMTTTQCQRTHQVTGCHSPTHPGPLVYPKEKTMEVDISVLLPEDAKKPLTEYQITMIANGLLIPKPAIAQRLAIELREARRSVEHKG